MISVYFVIQCQKNFLSQNLIQKNYLAMPGHDAREFFWGNPSIPQCMSFLSTRSYSYNQKKN